MQPIPDKDALDGCKMAAQMSAARKTLGIAQKALAIEMGITQPYLCDLERNRRHWSLHLFNEAKAAMWRLVQ